MAKDKDTGKRSENNKRKDSRREERRRRRIRNQIIAYLVLLVLIAGVAFGGYFGIKLLIKNIKPGDQQIITSDNRITESENNTGVISTPEEVVSMDEIPPEEEPVDPLQEEVAAYLSSMPIEQKVANLFIVTPESITGVTTATRAGDGTRTALEEYAVGGIVYAERNVLDAEQFKEMLANTRSMYQELYQADPWIVVQEEGAVNVIAGSATGVNAQQSAGEIGISGDTGNAYQSYVAIGSYLKEYGVNVNLGPVCDVPSEEESFLGSRAFNTDADIVSSMIHSAVDGQQEQGILTCLTSFPGQGAASGDPANGTASTEKTMDEMRAFDFLPFIAGIEEGAQMIMVSNMTAETASGEAVPCSMSTVMITDTLRGELGFGGVVITAPMDQKAITDNYDSKEAAVMALQAGADMILRPADFAQAYAGVLEAVADGTLSEERIDESLVRIYTLKFAE